ncbi:carboxylating nicotinate-nucleotide diphosphorylase [Oxalobacter formigenes]|uniref:carboxylating nicotinate-nucleotide diphosphorylase n=1 Tax=Oxalobacter formigenes TaxID=847 RepID=UPI0022AFC88F|nr:carboxylating nicotinate-nucleotide diphosphorylase [Oxalobacter formigenes]WAW02418.1 carboxylating nicotinate-nucleotide diphosphorylase [Oxalobacter formigenes]WAW02686.1 carboxylating nicotinate-nucleotide diphosphorylase [Oxalobacter formigenes]WAW04828.1 carboxylating nicotinate-nucleotide diphosphorylase [Oxalobacter formigenes]
MNRQNMFGYDDILETTIATNVEAALVEDIGSGDLTALLLPENEMVTARVIVRENAVLCGIPWFEGVMKALDSRTEIEWSYREGDLMRAGSEVCRMTGSVRSLLTGERTALNFLQMLSAVATATREYVELVAGTSARIYDTRKTLPGLRVAQKYAVSVGGGENQRMALYDAILIKENHIAAAGGIRQALQAAFRHTGVPVQIEVETIEQLNEALAAGAKSVMLDNFSLEDMREAVRITKESKTGAVLEASGGIDRDTVRAIAETGVDRISVGELTKHVKATDFSMRIV